jgi:hypothetical protein
MYRRPQHYPAAMESYLGKLCSETRTSTSDSVSFDQAQWPRSQFTQSKLVHHLREAVLSRTKRDHFALLDLAA